ncbi:neurofilament heavy polypeptide, putative [Ixodes scapularis]|uniref:Neurofilament heavy polypeptide, putative n=1 Tax=Ixodes scapularis TaxID=6945 RepID=B7QDF0_IXOSC|nr:neurofilament heavy polypeptide, putative [Ixodes scapularis]|eukprot:XP_002413564.1 neurofilament heavy polypeptide, putative [Ixodes scapularis]
MNSESKMKELPPGDPKLTASIVSHLKSRGLFDQLRRDCLGDVDTKPAYLNLKQRIEGYITKFLAMQTWTPDMNKNHVRDIMRREINESGMLSAGMDHLVDQIVNPKIYHVFTPEVEDGVRQYLGLSQPKEPKRQFSLAEKVDMMIMYVNTQEDPDLAPRLYAAEHLDRHVPASATFKAVFNRFHPTGLVQVQERRPPACGNETTQDVPGSCSPKLYTAVLTPEGFSDTSSEPQLMIVTESNERPEEADSSLREVMASPTVRRDSSVEPPGEESLQAQSSIVLADPVPTSTEPEERSDVPTQATDDQEPAARKAEDKRVDIVKKESRVSDRKHEERKGDVKKESKPASRERKDKRSDSSKSKDSSFYSSRSDSHAKNSSSKRSSSDTSRSAKTSKSKTEDGLPRDSRDSSREKCDQAKEKHSSSRERADSSRDETSRDRADFSKEEKGRSSSSSRASKTKDSRSERRRPDDKHHYRGSSQHHDDRRHHGSKSSREDDKSKDRSDSHRSHGEGRRDRDRSSTKDSSRQHKSSRSSEKHSDGSREPRKDKTQEKDKRPSVSRHQASEPKEGSSSKKIPQDLKGEKRSSDKKRQKRLTLDGHESDGAWSDVTVSSVHTSDLSSYDDRISVSSGEEDDEASKEKKRISLREIKKIASSSNEDEDRMSKSETEQVPVEKVSPDSTPMRKPPDIRESCQTATESRVVEFARSSSPPGVITLATVVDAPVSAATVTAPAHPAAATPVESPPEPKMGLRRQRKINPKYASEEFSSIFTEGRRPTGTIDFGAKHAREKHHEDVAARAESRKVSHPPPCEEPHEEAFERAPCEDKDQPFDSSGPERSRRPSRRHSGSEPRPRSESMSSKRYDSSDLYKLDPSSNLHSAQSSLACSSIGGDGRRGRRRAVDDIVGRGACSQAKGPQRS